MQKYCYFTYRLTILFHCSLHQNKRQEQPGQLHFDQESQTVVSGIHAQISLTAGSIIFRQQEQGGDHAPVLSTGEAAPWVLCSVLGSSLQEGHWGAGACPEKGNEAGEGSREQVLRGVAEGAGVV